MDDRALYMNAQILSIALTDLGTELYGPTYKQARLHVSAIASALADVEKRIREYPSARIRSVEGD
jgi:hypothetical protein